MRWPNWKATFVTHRTSSACLLELLLRRRAEWKWRAKSAATHSTCTTESMKFLGTQLMWGSIGVDANITSIAPRVFISARIWRTFSCRKVSRWSATNHSVAVSNWKPSIFPQLAVKWGMVHLFSATRWKRLFSLQVCWHWEWELFRTASPCNQSDFLLSSKQSSVIPSGDASSTNLPDSVGGCGPFHVCK